MCTFSNNLEGWQFTLPDSVGDWLWICQWECGCIMKSGIAYVWEINREDLDEVKPDLAWEKDSDTIFCLGWEGGWPVYLDKGPSIQYWKKLILPKPREIDGDIYYNRNNLLGFDKPLLRYINRENKS